MSRCRALLTDAGTWMPDAAYDAELYDADVHHSDHISGHQVRPFSTERLKLATLVTTP